MKGALHNAFRPFFYFPNILLHSLERKEMSNCIKVGILIIIVITLLLGIIYRACNVETVQTIKVKIIK